MAPGSLCGRNMSKETFSTMGEQRRSNPALRPMSRGAFVQMATSDLPEVPDYFARDVELNRSGTSDRRGGTMPPALPAPEVAALANAGATVLDVRSAAAFGTAHVPGALNIGLDGQFAPWSGTLVPGDRTVVIVAESEDDVREAAVRLARVGIEKVAGYLDGGIAAWDRAGLPLTPLEHVTVDELRARLAEDRDLQVVDVRRPAEYAAGHIPGAINRPLDQLHRDASAIGDARRLAVVCAGGYRSSAASSILQARGFRDIVNVAGGTGAWAKAGYPTEM